MKLATLAPALALLASSALVLTSCASQQTPTPTSTPTATKECPHKKKGHHTDKHHTAHHRFDDAEKWAKIFDDPKRDAFQKPAQVLAAMKLTPAMTVAEVGSGTGYYVMRLARAVPQGKVYGADIEPDMAAYLKKRAAREGLKNVTPVLAAMDDARLPEKVDRILVADTTHHIQGRTAYFKKLRASLNPGGLLVIVEFKKGDIPVGPPEAMRICAMKLDGELSAAGYTRVSLDHDTLPYHYIVTYK